MIGWRIGLTLWLLLIVAVTTTPWQDFDGRPHWDRVQWTPFPNLQAWGRGKWKEAVANVALFVPLGFLGMRALGGRGLRTAVVVGCLGLGLSTGAELFQVFTLHRYPTMTDICTNTIGALCGTLLGYRGGSRT
jgi:glycopeptide antibiotics resistance protein